MHFSVFKFGRQKMTRYIYFFKNIFEYVVTATWIIRTKNYQIKKNMGQLIKCYKHKNIIVTGNIASHADVPRRGWSRVPARRTKRTYAGEATGNTALILVGPVSNFVQQLQTTHRQHATGCANGRNK